MLPQKSVKPQRSTKSTKSAEAILCFWCFFVAIILRMSRSNLRSRMTNLLLVIPNLLLLSARLMVDPRVPTKERLLVAGAIVYALMPFDFIPDMLPVLGFTDDAAVLATAIRMVATHITPEHREAARAALKRGIDKEG